MYFYVCNFCENEGGYAFTQKWSCLRILMLFRVDPHPFSPPLVYTPTFD
uniref:Uncharacterized protein n=1 Tax=Anguilla anguilla TaxID=7936 RepID=A0A0E9WRZ3_ANGAN